MESNKKFEVKIYYSGFSSYEVDAEDEETAIKKARELPVNEKEIISNLESWHEADEVIEI